MSNIYTFISYSQYDNEFANNVAEALKENSIWIDKWEIEVGDAIIDKIEHGIEKSKAFLIILSKNSINSNWVKYELNMALIKYLQEDNYKLIVIRLDNVIVPLKLQPFHYIDINDRTINGVKKLKDFLNTKFFEDYSSNKTIKRSFINRADEITLIQDYIFDQKVKIICLIGFKGIGKASLLKEALNRIYQNPNYIEIKLTNAHFGSRLALDLCSQAGIEIPLDKSNEQEIEKKLLLSIEKLYTEKRIIIFDQFSEILNEDGRPLQDIKNILKHYEGISKKEDPPIFLLSRRWPNLKFLNTDSIAIMKIIGLKDSHLSNIIKNESQRIQYDIDIDENDLEKISRILQGYPLAAKLIASLIVRYGTSYILTNVHLLEELKVDLAEEILSNFKLTSLQTEILELLAIFGGPIYYHQISDVLNFDDDQKMIQEIDGLVNYNIVEPEGSALKLHSLINDFYYKLARDGPNFSIFSNKLAEISKTNLSQVDKNSKDYVFWLTIACRLLFNCGKIEESRALRYDLLGELKSAAIRLYQMNNYKTALIFCDEFLSTNREDKDVQYIKARSLSRLGNLPDSEYILKELIKNESIPRLLAKYYYGLGRLYLENFHDDRETFLKTAKNYFLESLKHNEHPSSLQSIGECLFKEGEFNEAASFLERKMKFSPSDPFALSLYADILWAQGEKDPPKRIQAMEKMERALKSQPKNANFLFRIGRFMEHNNKLQDAYEYYTLALKNDPSYSDPQLSLAHICIDLDKLDEAGKLLEELGKNDNLRRNKEFVFKSIKANYEYRNGNINKADELVDVLLKEKKDIKNLGLKAEIEMTRLTSAKSKGLNFLAETHKHNALKCIQEGLELNPNDDRFLNMKDRIEKMG